MSAILKAVFPIAIDSLAALVPTFSN